MESLFTHNEKCWKVEKRGQTRAVKNFCEYWNIAVPSRCNYCIYALPLKPRFSIFNISPVLSDLFFNLLSSVVLKSALPSMVGKKNNSLEFQGGFAPVFFLNVRCVVWFLPFSSRINLEVEVSRRTFLSFFYHFDYVSTMVEYHRMARKEAAYACVYCTNCVDVGISLNLPATWFRSSIHSEINVIYERHSSLFIYFLCSSGSQCKYNMNTKR